MNSKDGKRYDIVIYGASGFTGALVAEYFARRAPSNLAWAIAGRNLSKLNAIKQQLATSLLNSEIDKVGVLVCDNSSPESLDQMLSLTKVVLSTVGPYAIYGTPLVEACIRNSVHYCDITGETVWVKTLIDQFHELAQQKGVMIVPFCGFDSIPSDLGNLMVTQHIQEKYHSLPKYVKFFLTRSKGGVSGGTLASMFNLLDSPKKSKKLLSDPYLLNPPGEVPISRSNFEKDRSFMSYDYDIRQWTIPFVMASVNTRVVRRSNALLHFCQQGVYPLYNECMAFKSVFVALFLTLGMALFLLIASTPLRKIAQKFLPQPGEGPSLEQRQSGFFIIEFVARPEVDSANSVVRAIVKGTSDPGYGETSKMVSEAAFCLALDLDRLPGKSGGILTPASAMGQVLIERLKKAGMTFEITQP